MFLVLGRTIKESFINFWRNGLLSVAAVSVLALSLYVIGALFVITVTANSVLRNIEDKINVSVYFKSDVPEEKILEIKKDLENSQEVKSVDYISKDQALEDFKRDNANEPVIMQSLEEIGENPLLASLIVKAKESSQYQIISDYVSSASFKDDVSRVNYVKTKEIINKLNNVILQVERIGLVLAIIFGVVSILIIFNTVRITIYVHKQEIEVMRLVGASNMYIRLPFMFEGIIYGIVAALAATGLLALTVKIIDPYASSIIASPSLMDSYLGEFFSVFGIQVASGIVLGIISSWIAMRKYLKI